MLFLTDANGIPLACSRPIAGNHHDAFQITRHFTDMLLSLKQSGLTTNGLFLNADAGFDTDDLRTLCHQHEMMDNIDPNRRNGSTGNNFFDELLYKKRYVIERTNAWLDAFKAFAIRYETNATHWFGLNLLACIILIIKKL
ncbi:MAG: transposase [Chitinophagales bacterium]|nr:transposase [Chitinophagales bacterium]